VDVGCYFDAFPLFGVGFGFDVVAIYCCTIKWFFHNPKTVSMKSFLLNIYGLAQNRARK
jgi:hypothetical protein